VTITPEGRIRLTGFDNLYRRIWVFWRRLRGTSPPPEVERYRIVEVTPTSLQLKAHSPAPLETYRRKSDTDVLPPPIPVGATVW
jgi:hypothetical protein